MADLRTTLQFYPITGHALSVAEETALHSSLAVLSQQTKKDVRFWGKLLGYGGDYLLCQCTGSDVLADRRTYYSTDGGMTWTILDAVSDDQREFCEQVRGLFMGDPAYEYRIQKVLPPEEDIPAAPIPDAEDAPEAEGESDAAEENVEADGDDEEVEENAEADAEAEGANDAAEEGEEAAVEEKKPIKKKPRIQVIAIKESTRLAYFVEEHDFNCAVAPRGMYIRTQDGRVVKNKTFEGIDPATAGKLSSYYHLRKRDQATTALNADQQNLSIDFLDSIRDDIPRGVWCLKYDPLLDVVVGQNLYFLGSTFFVKPNSPISGQFYVGDGEQNLDLCFML
eukprot:PhM_4_TR654/c1_g1_i1/m.74506/K19757/RSPH9; radial spoke head protein 9